MDLRKTIDGLFRALEGEGAWTEPGYLDPKVEMEIAGRRLEAEAATGMSTSEWFLSKQLQRRAQTERSLGHAGCQPEMVIIPGESTPVPPFGP